MGLQIVTVGGPIPYLGVAGLGLAIATFPLLVIYGKQAKNAAALYNAGLSTAFNSYQLKFGTTNNGVGLIVKF